MRTSEEREPALDRMEQERREHNEEIRSRDACELCGTYVPDEDFSAKYAQAGGYLAGPFCSARCYWRWLA